MVMLQPALHALANHYGRPVDVLTSGAWSGRVLRDCDAFGEACLMAGTRLRVWWLSPTKLNAIRWFKRRPGSPIFMLGTSRKAEDILRVVGKPPGTYFRSFDYTLRTDEHVTEFNLRALRDWLGRHSAPVPGDGPSVVPELRVNDDELQDARQWLLELDCADRKLLLIQPGNKRTMRRGRLDRSSNRKFWPVENWARVAAGLLQHEPEARVLLCGVPAEQGMVAAIQRVTGDPRVLPVADDLPLSRLIALSHLAHSMVSVDTGPAHIAAAVGCPVLVMYGDTNPANFRPQGKGAIGVLTCARWSLESTGDYQWRESDRLTDIAPDRVVRAWSELNSNRETARA
jgi:heptosyltransferase-2/heptosyltransferase-3